MEKGDLLFTNEEYKSVKSGLVEKQIYASQSGILESIIKSGSVFGPWSSIFSMIKVIDTAT